jgi:hypothetical protein
MIENGTIREDGKRWDGSVWRKVGVNHHLNEEGLVYYKRKYRTLSGYLQQGGKIDRLVFNKMNPKDIGIFAKALYDNQKSGHVYVIVNDAWPEWVKIGKAIDAEDRHKAEKKAHIAAASATNHPWNKVDNGEWFKLSHEQAIEILEGIA